ncbi:SDR family oxidoreductase [Arcticibacter sp.]|uniref:SDR family oxidoreductase n=1 Tax=Arcticibacter sp. TaxID=1872630 RepID=UPI0038904BB9
MKTKKVWFVTGASKGLGLTLVKNLLKNGYSVAATSRKIDDLIGELGEADGQFLPLEVDIRSETSVESAIEKAFNTLGRLDVVVNNAGYGLTGAIEELSDKEVRDNFDINVFGSLNVIRKALPYMRAQGCGHIFNISSIGGFTGLFPGFGIYCATKFAVHGFTESLAAEVKAFGIHATVVFPGYFRTNFLSAGSLNVPEHEIPEYREVRTSQAVHQNEINGNQPNDPEKGVATIVRIAESENPPLHLFLGQDAYELAEQKIALIEANMSSWRDLAATTAF